MRDLSPVVFRGEPDGALRQAGDYLHPYFFTETYAHAQLYGRGTDPVLAVIQGNSFLDLTDLSPTNPAHQKIIADLTAAFDDWICRISGEPRLPWGFIEAGDLYDYEGNGSGERWRRLLNLALDSYDAVCVLDGTDGTDRQPSKVWVTRERANIREPTFGEQLAALLQVKPWAWIQRWLDRDYPDLLARISRLTVTDEDYRLDQVHKAVPASNLRSMGIPESTVMDVYRALPGGADIRPGDWVATRRSYAERHVRTPAAGEFEVKALPRVQLSDVYWAGTDENEFFYLPAAWRLKASSAEAYLRQLTPEMIRILCDGEEARLTRHRAGVESIRTHVMDAFDHGNLGLDHGADHWERVRQHSHAVSRSLGVDPLIGHLFALVHDSQREDEGSDPEHGPRAAAFVLANRAGLFGFLSDGQIAALAHACREHSNGMTQGLPEVQACWDADRLDLWRVGATPDPQWLCTDYAKDEGVIAAAQTLLEQDRGEVQLGEREPSRNRRFDSNH
jgi:uncharacterized protein